MTTSVIVTRKGGNQPVNVIVENFYPAKAAVESGDMAMPAQWKDVSVQTLQKDGDSSTEIYVYDNQRVRVEETTHIVTEPKVD